MAHYSNNNAYYVSLEQERAALESSLRDLFLRLTDRDQAGRYTDGQDIRRVYPHSTVWHTLNHFVDYLITSYREGVLAFPLRTQVRDQLEKASIRISEYWWQRQTYAYSWDEYDLRMGAKHRAITASLSQTPSNSGERGDGEEHYPSEQSGPRPSGFYAEEFRFVGAGITDPVQAAAFGSEGPGDDEPDYLADIEEAKPVAGTVDMQHIVDQFGRGGAW